MPEPKSNGRPEAELQRRVVKALRPILGRGVILHHSANEVPGGGKKAKLRQSILKGMGVHAGFADLVILGPGRAAVFLELKAGRNDQSDAQRAFERDVLALGFAYEVIRTEDQAITAVIRHGIPTRLTEAAVANFL